MDWIDAFMTYTDGLATPVRFRLWAGIAAIGGALERRCRAETSVGAIYPNLYTVLVGPPTSGKTLAIDVTNNIWIDAKSFHIAPKSLTGASLVDDLFDADRKIILPNNTMMEFHSLLIPVPELGTFVNAHDLSLFGRLNDIWDNPRYYSEKRRSTNGGKTKEITNPQINILAGAQPGFLAELLPEQAWKMGLTSRIILIYANSSPQVELFKYRESNEDIRKSLLSEMARMVKMAGLFQWEPAAAHEVDRWYKEGMIPKPTHSKLEYYSGRRIMQFIKLCMIAAVARSREETVLRLCDINRARDWLLEAEQFMPDIFRDMVLKSDFETIQEMHFHLWQLWSTNKNTPLHEEALWTFLTNRVPSEKIKSVIEAAEKSGTIGQAAGQPGCWIPKPLRSYGIE